MELVSEFYPKDDEEAANMTTQILNATPDVKFFFCFNNGFAIAAANEITAAVPDVSDYLVFSSEGDEESFRLNVVVEKDLIDARNVQEYLA